MDSGPAGTCGHEEFQEGLSLELVAVLSGSTCEYFQDHSQVGVCAMLRR